MESNQIAGNLFFYTLSCSKPTVYLHAIIVDKSSGDLLSCCRKLIFIRFMDFKTVLLYGQCSSPRLCITLYNDEQLIKMSAFVFSPSCTIEEIRLTLKHKQ